MGDLYELQVHSVNGSCLTCRVTALCEHDGYGLPSSQTLAIGFLWDTTQEHWWLNNQLGGRALQRMEAAIAAESTPLGRELAPHNLWSFDGDLWRTIASRCISCVGVVDRSVCDREADFETRLQTNPQGTYHITVRDPRWLEHLAPGMEWGSRVWDQDCPVVCDPTWLTFDVLALAQGIRDDLAFDRLPILADALQEAGCANEYLLGHCRGPGAHAPGCWAMDLPLRGPFDPQRLDVTTIRDLQVRLKDVEAGARLSADWAKDRETIAELVSVIRSGLKTVDHGDRVQGTIWFQRWGEEWAELCFFPGHDPEWYEFRAGGRAYRVRRAKFVTALQRAGVELPLGRH